LKSYLAVSDGNDVSGNVSGHITTLGLDDRQSSERTTTELVVHLGRTLEETRVEVEDVTGVSLTAGRTTCTVLVYVSYAVWKRFKYGEVETSGGRRQPAWSR
jgi:hypothetical protein